MDPEPDGIERLVERFLGCAIPRKEWTHEAHLAVGLWHVARFGPEEALTRLRSGIRKLNESNGVPNTGTEGYHESITRAYVVLLAEFLRSLPDGVPLGASIDLLRQSELSRRDVLLRFYARETLMSARARTEWVEPDRLPLRLGTPSPGRA